MSGTISGTTAAQTLQPTQPTTDVLSQLGLTGSPTASQSSGNTGGRVLLAGGRRPTPTPTSRPTPQATPSTQPTQARNIPNIVNSGLSQRSSEGAGDDYQWAPGFGVGSIRVGQQNGKISEIGCTLTAFTNGLNAANPGASLSLRDANNLTQSFNETLQNTTFTDLSGQNKRVYGRNGQGPKIEQMSPVDVNSSAGSTMQQSIRNSLTNGNPVLVGFRNSDGSQTRHSATAVGYSGGQIQILDAYTGKVVPMDKFLSTYGYDKPQFDYAYSMRAK